MPDRNIQPEIKKIDAIHLQKPRHDQLGNGIPLYQIKAGMQDITRIEIIFKAGTSFHPNLLVPKYACKLLTEGTHSFSAQDIASKLDYNGAQISTQCSKDFSSIVLYSLNKHLKNLLPLLQEIVLQPVFNEEEFEIINKNERDLFLVNERKVKHVAKENLNRLLYQQHPYGRATALEDFEKVKLAEVKSFYTDYYGSDNCMIIISGKLNNHHPEWIDRYFGPFKNKSCMSEQLNVENADYQPLKQHLQKDDALQSAIRIGKPLFNKMHPDFIKLSILSTALGGYFGSRLMSNIREDKGYTYGIVSSLASFLKSGYFFISTEVGTQVKEQTLHEIYKEIKILQEQPIPEEELTLVKNYIIGHLLQSLDGVIGLSENFKNLITYNLDFNYINNYIETVNSIKANELRELAKRYLSIDTLSEVTVG